MRVSTCNFLRVGLSCCLEAWNCVRRYCNAMSANGACCSLSAPFRRQALRTRAECSVDWATAAELTKAQQKHLVAHVTAGHRVHLSSPAEDTLALRRLLCAPPFPSPLFRAAVSTGWERGLECLYLFAPLDKLRLSLVGLFCAFVRACMRADSVT